MIQRPESANMCAASSSKNLATSQEDMDAKALQDLRERIAVRFLIKKSKRFDFSKTPPPCRLQLTTLALNPQPLESLFYLGLAPKNSALLDRNLPIQGNETDPLFRKPAVYECTYCMKVFFHKTPHRRHMIGHIKKIHACAWCNQRFASVILKRRHQYSCRR